METIRINTVQKYKANKTVKSKFNIWHLVNLIIYFQKIIFIYIVQISQMHIKIHTKEILRIIFMKQAMFESFNHSLFGNVLNNFFQ